MRSCQLEILLFTHAVFSSKQFCGKCEDSEEFHNRKCADLECACWNGRLQEVLPELYADAASGEGLVLWKIFCADHFLDLEYGNLTQKNNFSQSINPYLFLSTQLQS
jgi:hypothetical protein